MEERLTERQQELVEKNHNLIYGFANLNKLSIEEYYGVLAIGLCNAAKTYSESDGSFSTFAYTCMRNALINYFTHTQRNGVIPAEKIVSYDAHNSFDDENSNDYLNCFTENNPVCDTVISNMMLESFRNLLTEKENIVVTLLLYSIPQSQIAERMGCSKQNIGYCVNQIRKKLVKYLENC